MTPFTTGDDFLPATLPALDLAHNLARRLMPRPGRHRGREP
jgi:hypothetical protein